MFNLFNKPQPSAPLPQRPIVQPRGSSHPTSVFNLPPQKVIRAEKDYSAKFTKELGFKKGDFFYVIGGDYVEYYEVINPETKQRGIVPVDCFENMLKSSKVQSAPPSTRFTSPRESLDRVFEVSTQEEENQDTIEQISVPAVESKENGIFNFIVELRFLNNRRRILHRTYDDFWVLQVSLLNHFPTESGRNTRPRIIPFMDQPTKNWTTSISQQKRQQLDAYLQDLISLPTAIIDSQCVKRFLTLKGSDIETFIEMEFDSSEMILDLIGDYLETDEIKFTAVIGQKVAHWNIKEFCGYDELVRDIEQRMNEYVPCLCYEDECMELITLYGDNDLRLLLRTRKSLSLFVVEKE